MERKTEILNKIKGEGYPGKEVVVSLEEFFDGNEDDGSIGANLYPDQPSLKNFYDTFKGMVSSGEVESIFVRIADAEDSDWFYTDTVYVIGNITLKEVKEMLKELKPDEIYSGWMYGMPVNLQNVKIDMPVYSVWWD